MNVETGRFISQDIYEGSKFEQKSLHKYLYVANNPVNSIDPSGYFEMTIAGQLITVNVHGILSTMSNILAVAAVACAAEAGATAALDIDRLTPCGIKRERRILYHYTEIENLLLIEISGVIWASGGGTGRDAVYGDGQYFTDATPIEALGNGTMHQFSYALYKFPYRWGRNSKPIGYLMIDVARLRIERVNDLYGERYAGRGNFLHRSTSPLNVRSRIKGSGIVPFN